MLCGLGPLQLPEQAKEESGSLILLFVLHVRQYTLALRLNSFLTRIVLSSFFLSRSFW
jgi:hypothetical protein